MSARIYFDNERDYVEDIYHDYDDDVESYAIRPYSAEPLDGYPYDDEYDNDDYSEPTYFDDGEYHSFVDDADPENDYDDHYNPNKHPNAYMERMQAVPFHGETTYQDAYPWKEPQIPKRRRSASGRDLPPFYDDTTNKVDYIPKVPKATKTFKPKYEGLSNEIPFHGQTSHKVDYVPRQAQRQKAIKKESNLGPSNADFHGKTLHQLDYDGRKGERAKPTRVQSEPLFPKTNTIDSTTHKASYVRLKNENCPAEAILNKARGWEGSKFDGHYYVKVRPKKSVTIAQNDDRKVENRGKAQQKSHPKSALKSQSKLPLKTRPPEIPEKSNEKAMKPKLEYFPAHDRSQTSQKPLRRSRSQPNLKKKPFY